MPTTFGNVIRAAEDYAQSRYSADYLIVWPRLAHVCSERFVMDYEAMRADVDFLLVVATYSGLFAAVGGGLVLYQGASVLLFVACVLMGVLVAHIAYRTAIKAAVEYGEQMRASMDLFRLDLLQQLRYAAPTGAEDERAIWREFDSMLKRGHPRTRPFANPLLGDSRQ